MVRSVFAFPVAPGKSDADAKLIAQEFRSRPREFEESRRRLGVTLERAYLQKTSMGSFVVAYIEATRDPRGWAEVLTTSELEIDLAFVRLAREIHGVDPLASQGPVPETVAEWFDPRVTTRGSGMAFCAPLLPDAIEQAKSFLGEAFSSPLFTDSRRKLSENGEVAGLVSSPQGSVGTVYLEGVDPFAANRRFAASQDPFDLWFKEQLKTIFPPFVDFSQPVTGVEEIFDSAKVASLGGAAERRVA